MNVVTTVHLDDSHPEAKLFGNGPGRTFVAVTLGSGEVQILAFDPAQVALLAETLTDAARLLSQQLDVEAARAINAEQVPA